MGFTCVLLGRNPPNKDVELWHWKGYYSLYDYLHGAFGRGLEDYEDVYLSQADLQRAIEDITQVIQKYPDKLIEGPEQADVDVLALRIALEWLTSVDAPKGFGPKAIVFRGS